VNGMQPPQPPGMPAAPAAPGGVAPLQVYDLDMNAIRQHAEEINAMSTSHRRESDFASFKKGLNFVRFLPPWSPEIAAKGQFTKFHLTHFNVIPNAKQRCSCWEASLPNMGFRCPICHIRNTFGRYMGDMVKDSEPRGYHYANAVVYTSPDNGVSFMYKRLKPYVFRIPVTVWTGLMQMMQRPYIGNITSVDNGWIIGVKMPESFSGKNTYEWGQVVQGPLAGDENTKSAILADLHNLDTFGDFGIPTVEKLQRQFQLAESFLEWACQVLQVTDPTSQIPGFGQLELVVPPIVEKVHGTQSTVVGMPGSAPPVPGAAPVGTAAPVAAVPQPATPAAVAPPAVPVAAPTAALPAAAPAAPAATPAPSALLTAPAPNAGPTAGAFPGMPAAPAAPRMPMAPAVPAAAAPGMPMAPAVPSAPPAAAPLPPAPLSPATPPMPPTPAAPPVPGSVPMAGAAPAAVPASPPTPAAPPSVGPAPAPVLAPGGQAPFPFPQAPAPQPQGEATSPIEGAGAEKAKKAKSKKKKDGAKVADGKVKCPGCGKPYSGSRGLKVHMNKSPACQKAAAEAPPTMEQVAPQATPQPAAPTPAVATAAPAGMGPPAWPEGQTGPLPPTA
jgi:hypothetical protein